MARRTCAVLAVHLAWWGGPAAAESPLHALDSSQRGDPLENFTGIKLDLYRAMRAADVRKPFGNQDFASISGVMSYIHTEVIPEHSGCNTHYGKKKPGKRHSRCHNIDSVVQARFFVKNPEPLVAEVGSMSQYVDFGWDSQFRNGMASWMGPQLKRYGDFVGAARHKDARFPITVPGHWFSLSGVCPNRVWSRKFKKKGLPSSGLASGCLKYDDKSGFVKGGLCPGTLPTGERGCTYNYVPPAAAGVISLDDLAGITREDCGKRKCKDWRDFRRHCTNKAYKRRFNYNRRRSHTVKHSNVCIEYDVHWSCAGSWDTEDCHAIPVEKREIGLPFWRGRGLALQNMRRIERLAALFGVEGARSRHSLVAEGVRANFSTCMIGDEEHMCHPRLDEGGMYCTRQWGGICQPCYVPGTAAPYKRAAEDPACPWNLFWESKDFGTFSNNFTLKYMTVSRKGDCPSKEHAGLGAPPSREGRGPMFVVESDPSHRYESNITRLWLSFDLSSLAGAQVISAKLLLHQSIHANRSDTQLFLGRATGAFPASGCPRISWEPSGFEARSAVRLGGNGMGPGVRGVSLLHKANVLKWVRQWVAGKVPNYGFWVWLGHNNSAAYFDSAELQVVKMTYPFECKTDRPRDLCCLYKASCNSTIPSDPLLAPLDENGFAIVSARQDTGAMLAFLKRVIKDRLRTVVTDPRGLEKFAYWAWHDHPLGGGLIDAEVGLAPYVRDRPGAGSPPATSRKTPRASP